MKKILSIAVAVFSMYTAQAQLLLEKAQEAMAKNNLVEAKQAIDELTAKEQKNAAVYFTKAAIYQTMADDPKLAPQVPNGHAIALENYRKYAQVDPKYKPALLKTNLINLMIAGFNTGIAQFNERKNTEAVATFKSLADIVGFDGGKVLGTDKFADTLATQAKMYSAYALYNDTKYAEAQTIFEGLVDNPIVRDADLLLRLAQCYSNSTGYDAKYLSVITKGRAAFPANSDLLKLEIDYYAQRNENKKLLELLDNLSKLEPTNAEVQFNIGATCDELAKESAKTDAKMAETYSAKAVAAYEKASSLDPSEGNYYYAIGSHFYNRAADMAPAMNAVIEDQAKYKPLEAQFKELLKKSAPYLEKAVTAFESKGPVKKVNEQ
ncbi:MAG: hypothetical protein RL660_741, partial [Bacteroidota bacterium]